MEESEKKDDLNKSVENKMENKENIPNPEATGFFTLSYKNGDKFSGQLTKGEIDTYGIYEGSKGFTFEGDFEKPDDKSKEKRLKGTLISLLHQNYYLKNFQYIYLLQQNKIYPDLPSHLI